MTPSEQFWLRVNRKAGSLTPDVAREIFKAFSRIREGLSDAELVRLVTTGQLDKLFDEQLSMARLEAAFQPVRDRMRSGIVDGVKFFSRDIPKKPGVTIGFDILSPDTITAIRNLETKVVSSMADDVRETVRAYVENGLRDGDSPEKVGRTIKSIIGLPPKQEEIVRSFRSLLEAGDPDALKRQLRDRRFDQTLDKAFAGEKTLSEEQIDKMVTAYRNRAIAQNAQTVARTATGDALKLGQKLAIDSAIDQGIYDRSSLTKRWKGVMDTRERPEHVAMEGETVPYDEPFSNGEMIPGDSTYNCRCVPIYRQ